MPRLISFAGLLVMLFLAWLLSDNRRKMNWRLIASGVVLQLALAVIILRTVPGQYIFDGIRILITRLISFSAAGSAFVFGEGFKEHPFAFSVLPTIIFVSSLMTVLFHLGVLQKIVEFMAKIMVYVMDTAGAESLASAANVFIGMAEAPLVIRPYIKTMTRSEIMAMMTGGMATISGALLVAYTGFGADAGHLLAASIISAPAALVIAKIMVPETEQSQTKGTVKVKIPKQDVNILEAACRGAVDGVKLAINIAAVLICFIAFVALVNWLFSFLPGFRGQPFTLERILGWFCSPIAWIMGVEWKDASVVGSLLGKRTVLNEFIAYLDLAKYKETLSPRSFTIATYALCGFANFGSIAILIGGLSTLVPERRTDFATLGFKSMLAGTLACFMTATIAGMLV
ncbi:MAG: NupC/NupG family nucleoside CNT transporter [Planctomycetes bacterium HGW-Planctomycetes-1]|nr:MAG: NupC/NupG family nucleoside CNT transporter [Planctomycetes bacterium HGW-Planctomycetes-1]